MFKTDIAIFGSGIAGLWTLNRLCKSGYNCVLIEKDKLGGIQTIASQGMIHGGQKYALPGTKHGSSVRNIIETTSKMPSIWNACFLGKGEIDLSDTSILSEKQFLWSPGSLGANAVAYLATKMLNTATDHIKDRDRWPRVIRENSNKNGRLYIAPEAVVDVKSLVKSLTSLYMDRIYKADITKIKYDNNIEYIELRSVDNTIRLCSSIYIFTAGAGNEQIIKNLGITFKAAQKRGLKQIMIKGIKYPFYGHVISVNPKPRLTITSHPADDGTFVWYLGGMAAETGVQKTDAEAISYAYKEIKGLFPNLDTKNLKWAAHSVDRAEPYRDGLLPDGPEIMEIANAAVVWPAKMTLAPALGREIVKFVDSKNISVSNETTPLPLPKPEMCSYPWETAKNWVFPV